MIDITNASLRWSGDRVYVTAGDPELAAGEYGHSITSLTEAMAAGWAAVTVDGYAVADVHAALLGLDRYAEAYREP